MKDYSIGKLNTREISIIRENSQRLLDVGTMIDQYRVISLLGTGGMGQVYLVEDSLLNKYALKLLHPKFNENSSSVDRFHIEGKVMSDLTHSNIVKVHSCGESKGLSYFIMDYIIGYDNHPMSLEEYLNTRQKLSEIDAYKIIKQLCSALDYAHRYRVSGIIHRDLKPSNILLDADLNVYISDFGLAKIVGKEYLRSMIDCSIRLTKVVGEFDKSIGEMKTLCQYHNSSSDVNSIEKGVALSLIGTYEYMSPEQQEGREASVQSDIYSLGLIIYRLITGIKPKGRFELPSELGFSKFWNVIIEKSLQCNPENRFDSVDEIIKFLDGSNIDFTGANINFAKNIISDISKFECEYKNLKDRAENLTKFNYLSRDSILTRFKKEKHAYDSFPKKYSSAIDSLYKQKGRDGSASSPELGNCLAEVLDSYKNISLARLPKEFQKLKSIYISMFEDMFNSISVYKSEVVLSLQNLNNFHYNKKLKFSTAVECNERLSKEFTDELSKVSRTRKSYLKYAAFIITTSFLILSGLLLIPNKRKLPAKEKTNYKAPIGNSIVHKKPAAEIISVDKIPVAERKVVKSSKTVYKTVKKPVNKELVELKNKRRLEQEKKLRIRKLEQERKLQIHKLVDSMTGSFENKQYRKAEKLAGKILSLDSNNKEAENVIYKVGIYKKMLSAHNDAESIKKKLESYKFVCGKTPEQTTLMNSLSNDLIMGQGFVETEQFKKGLVCFQKIPNIYNKIMLIEKVQEKKLQENLKAFDLYMKSAKSGNSEAMYNLACLYRDGRTTSKNDPEALHWFQKAADKGNVNAMYNLGRIYQTSLEQSPDAFKWYTKAADKGNDDAMYCLAEMYRKGEGTEKDLSEAFDLFLKSAEKGNVRAMVAVGTMYAEGFGVSKDSEDAFKWYMKAAEKNNPDAMYNVGYMYSNGLGVLQNYTKTKKWYEKSLTHGNSLAAYNLACMYFEGVGTEKNYKKAMHLYLISSAKGYSYAMYNLGYMYMNGFGTEVDYVKAFNWFMKSAELGNPDAMFEIGYMYYKGLGRRENIAKAYKWFVLAAKNDISEAMYYVASIYMNKKEYGPARWWFIKSADKGNSYAMNFLGDIYIKGLSVKKNYDKAFDYYEEAAEKGNAAAMLNLGMMYSKGIGVSQNYSTALNWYQKSFDRDNKNAGYELELLYRKGFGSEDDHEMAYEKYQKMADKGNYAAMILLGTLYKNGLGGPVDREKAFTYYKIAAENGNPTAMYNLGCMYKEGIGTDKNYPKAFEWFKKAAVMNNIDAMNSLGNMYENELKYEVASKNT
ncbi:MAG: protein kinase [bacterium]|nr:protein kinase [bacterium]